MSAALEEDDIALAAEYALGLLSGAELAQIHRRATEDAAFARLVTEWETQLAPLAEDLPPEVPPASTKTALMAELFPEAARTPFWQRPWLWQALGALSLVALVLVFSGQDPQGERGPLYTAEIVSAEGDFRVVAVVDKSTDEVILTRTAGAAPPGRILQVWGHGEGEPTISVGLWPEGDSVRLPMPPDIAAVEGILTLGVSEEPPGGSPTGLPSGRVFGTVDIPGVTTDL